MRQPGRWLAQEPRPDARARIFCLPFTGTGAGLLRAWPARVEGTDVCRVQLPGRENRIREAPYSDFDTFARAAAEGLAPYLDRPYAVFGHCMGALLAHKLVRRLQDLPVRPAGRLIVSSSLPPHYPPARRYRPPGADGEGIYHPSMSDTELAVEMRRIARAQGQPDILPELLPLAIRVLRHDLDMCFSYAPAAPEPVTCPITAIGWSRDDDVPPARMASWNPYSDVTHRILEGDKLTFIRAPRPLMDLLAEECLAITTEAEERR
jgi:surfactin synthase thioesterase subunit